MTQDQVEFATFCISNVARELRLSQRETYLKLRDSGILRDYIVGAYEAAHTFSTAYIVEDITDMMRERKVI